MKPVINLELDLINQEENALIVIDEIIKNCINNSYKLFINQNKFFNEYFENQDYNQAALTLLMLLKESTIDLVLSKENQKLVNIEIKLEYILNLKIYPIEPFITKTYGDNIKTDIDTSFYINLSLNLVKNLAIRHMLAENF